MLDIKDVSDLTRVASGVTRTVSKVGLNSWRSPPQASAVLERVFRLAELHQTTRK